MAVPFDQEVRVYRTSGLLKTEANALAIARNLYIHTIVTHHGQRGEELVVVYRKVEK